MSLLLVLGSLSSTIFFTAINPVARAEQSAPVLVELFTSQGCYSCPPADELLGELGGRDDVIAPSFHVTYWDRLGWPDTFGHSDFTQRQYDYATIMNSRSVYTPQAVVAGEIDVVGSNRSRLEAAIDLVRREGQARRIAFDSDGLARIGDIEIAGETQVWAAAYENAARVAIERGENGGKTLTYHHIVRELLPLGNFDGNSRQVELPLREWREAGHDGFALVVQERASSRVLALGQLELSASTRTNRSDLSG